MKKAFIIIATITLLLTLLIPNIALATIMPCGIFVEPGCAGEKTKITLTTNGWSTINNGAGELRFYYGLINTDTNEFIKDPDSAGSYYTDSNDPSIFEADFYLPAGNYQVAYVSFVFGGRLLSYCPTPTNASPDYTDYNTWLNVYFTIEECPTPEPKPCHCSLLVQKRGEAGHPIENAVFKVDGIEKTTRGGDARWDDLECDTTYEVRELKPEKRTKRIHLGDCGERSTLRIVNKIEEVVVEEVIIPEAGLDLNYLPILAITGLGILRILLGIKRKRK